MNTPAPRLPTDWRQIMGAGLKSHWAIKTAGITAFMTVFFAGYFYVLKHPVNPVVIIPSTPVDEWLGFHPWTLVPYLSLWVYVSLAPGLLATRAQLVRHARAAITLAVIGLAIFYFWPTKIIPPALDWQSYPAFTFLKTIDASGNACPSLHVAFAVFAAMSIHRSLRQMGAPRALVIASWIWALAIAYSTLATKQHVVIDALAGAALGAAVALLLQRDAAAQRS